MRPLNLREYAEQQRALGLSWADEMLDAADAKEAVDRCETLDDEIRTALEDAGCEQRHEKYDTLREVRKLCDLHGGVAELIDDQEETGFHTSDDPVENLTNGIAQLRKSEESLLAIQSHLVEIGACDWQSDILATLKLLFG